MRAEAAAGAVETEGRDTARSAAVLIACGYRIIPLLHPIGSWNVLAVNSRGLILVATCREWPRDTARFGHPASFPPCLKLLHRWGDGPLPEVQAV